MRLPYTTTFAIIGVGQMAVRAVLTYVVDPVPFASFGVFWEGVAALLFFLVLGPVLDLASGVWWLVRRVLRR